MAGLFALRELKTNRAKFDPFALPETDDEDDLDDVEEPEDDGKIVTAPAMKTKARFEVNAAEAADAAFDVTDEPAAASAKPKLPPLAPLEPAWETPCEMIYEDDDAEVFCVRFNPEDKLLATGCGDSVVRIFHCDDGRLAYNLERDGVPTRLPVTCLRWRPTTASSATKNVLLAANADGTVQHWHVTSRKCLHTISEEGNQVYALDYRADATMFATAGKDYAVRVYDEATKSVTAKLAQGWAGAPSAGHSNRVFAVKFVPDEPQLLLSAGWDNTVQIWDLRTSQPCASIYGPHVCGDSIDVSGHEVLTGSWRQNKQLQIWDRRNCELAVDVPFRPAAMDAGSAECHVYACQFTKPTAAGPGMIAAGGSGSNELKVFSKESKEPLGRLTLPRGVYGLDTSHDGASIAVAGGDCKVRVLRMPGAPPKAGTAAAAPAPAPAAGAPNADEPIGLA